MQTLGVFWQILLNWNYIYGGTLLGNTLLTNSFYLFLIAYIPWKLRKEITGISLNVGIKLGGNFVVIVILTSFNNYLFPLRVTLSSVSVPRIC